VWLLEPPNRYKIGNRFFRHKSESSNHNSSRLREDFRVHSDLQRVHHSFLQLVIAKVIARQPDHGKVLIQKRWDLFLAKSAWLSYSKCEEREVQQQLSERFIQAFEMASDLHSGQHRKGTDIPYISHLMSVSALVIEHGGTEDQAIAALLHDAVEDQGGLKTLETIRAAFGETVAEIVLACSDSVTEEKPPWRERKETYLSHLSEAEPVSTGKKGTG
jgi:hypothetical protein